MQLIPLQHGVPLENSCLHWEFLRAASIKLNRCQGGMPAAVAVVRGTGEEGTEQWERQLVHKASRVGQVLPVCRNSTLPFVRSTLPFLFLDDKGWLCHPTLSKVLFACLHMHQCSWPPQPASPNRKHWASMLKNSQCCPNLGFHYALLSRKWDGDVLLFN